jgi:hypothetical protein
MQSRGNAKKEYLIEVINSGFLATSFATLSAASLLGRSDRKKPNY